MGQKQQQRIHAGSINPHLWFVIAAYNEAKGIKAVVSKLLACGYHNVVVVDDCSSDHTFSILSSLPIHALRHSINRGQGAALRTGIEYVLRLDSSRDVKIVTFDADGQHRVEDIPAILLPLGRYDIVLGSRFLSKRATQEIPFMKRMVLRLGVLFTYLMYGIRVTDSQNGFRALSRKAATAINITEDRMEHASQILEEIKKSKLRFCEVPVFIPYQGKRSQSWTNSVAIGLRLIFSKFLK